MPSDEHQAGVRKEREEILELLMWMHREFLSAERQALYADVVVKNRWMAEGVRRVIEEITRGLPQ